MEINMTNRCQVFTPKPYVLKMLNAVNYKGNQVLKKYVLENSCGEGNILIQIVSRYIKTALKEGYSVEQVKDDLQTYIIGFEIDNNVRKYCINNLNEVTEKYGIKNVEWKVLGLDYLRFKSNYKFHYIIGNPPYIKYHDLNELNRNFLRNNFESCKKGKFDYCYAFIEKGLIDLHNEGKMIYIIPNSIFKNVYAESIRNIMLPLIKTIYDYKESTVFKNALTSPAIILFDRSSKGTNVKYIDEDNKQTIKIRKQILMNKKKWLFSCSPEKSASFILGDFFKISNSVATLKNSVFVINEKDIISECSEYISVNGFRLEKTLLKKAASPRAYSYNMEEYIIFPYFYADGELKRYSDKELNHNFPEAYKYLKFHKKELDKRTSDKAAEWFEYGRSQALRYLNQEKLMISSIITDNIKTYKLDIETIPYSGFYIIAKGNQSLQLAEEILSSKEFLEYITLRSINANGKSVRCSVKEIMKFPLNLEIDWNEI
jgi:adenine-specific DNA-methyltransferase